MKPSESKVKIFARLRAIGQMLRLTHRLEPRYLPIIVVRSLLQASTPFINIYFTARILDELTGERHIEMLTLWVLWTLGLNLLAALVQRGTNRLEEMYGWCKLNASYMFQMNRLLYDTDYENLDNPDVRVHKQKIDEGRNMSSRGPWSLGPMLSGVLGGVIAVVLAAVLSAPIFSNTGVGALASPALTATFFALIVAVSAGSALYSLSSGKKIYHLFDCFLYTNRVFFSLGSLLNHQNYGKDARLYRQQGLIRQAFDRISGFNIVRNIARASGRSNALGAALTATLGGSVYLFVGLKALAGAMTIGTAFQVIGAISQFIGGFTGLVGQASEFWLNGEYIKDYMDFLATPNAKYQGTLPVEKRDDHELELELRHVSFRYPGAEDWALRDVNLKLRIGERLAVVGRNGSGKTTMIKLLCRLYDPQEGEILLNGIDIRKYDYAEYMRLFSVVFQDFKLFAAPLEQNVAAGMAPDRERVARCLREAGFDPEGWPLGLETPLYKVDECGVEPSGGEAQKIALARALYKDAPVVVLDEPTAALDPIAEHDIYTRFNGFVGDRTAIYISHRLSSCRFCDDIAVFDGGRIVQRGGHEELLADGEGLYHQLWNAQAQYYQGRRWTGRDCLYQPEEPGNARHKEAYGHTGDGGHGEG